MTDVGITELEREEEFIQQWVALEARLGAPSGKYKLILCDKFDYSDAIVGVFDTLEETINREIPIMDNFRERDSRDLLGKGD